jgi:hypothetical protein
MNGQLLQLAISLGEVALMVGLSILLFGWRANPKADLAGAVAREVPGFRPGRTALSAGANAALVENAKDGTIYLAVLRGDGVVTRKLVRGTGLSRDGARLTLTLHDFTLKRATLDLADAADWEARLKGSL